MPSYVQVEPNEIPIGKIALVLFIDEGELCAGILEHRCDGRFDRRVPDHPSPNDLVLVICNLMARQGPDETLYIVIEEGAYWPEPFPALTVQQAA